MDLSRSVKSGTAIRRKVICLFLCIFILLTGLPSGLASVKAAVVMKQVERTYYHLDLGVQVVERYANGKWYKNAEYGSFYPGSLTYTLSIGAHTEGEFKLTGVYSYEDFSGTLPMDDECSQVTHNLTVSSEAEFTEKYGDYTALSMSVTGYSASGRNVGFSYSALMETKSEFEIYEYANAHGYAAAAAKVYSLFNDEESLRVTYPIIYESVRTALTDGAAGGYGDRRCYLVFCPTVVEYTVTTEEETEIGDMEAGLFAPDAVRQNESFEVRDATLLDEDIEIDHAVLERRIGGGEYEQIAVWQGNGVCGANTGGRLEQSFADVCTVTYRLTAYSTMGLSDTAEATVSVRDGRQIDGKAELALPSFTYEGHTATASDISIFTVDGKSYMASAAYKDGVASNSFDIVQSGVGSISRVKGSNTEANAVFTRTGKFNVRLDIDLINGAVLSDTKAIEVRKTPYIEDSLGGTQKQNRKQTVTAVIATHPESRLSGWYIKVRDSVTGEEAVLTADSPQSNTENIKTRAVSVSGDNYFTTLRLEFLTKAPHYDGEDPDHTQDYEYEIYAVDSRGMSDLVSRNFSVAADKPPEARIGVEPTFIRNEGSNIAVILAEDTSSTDGDQLEREWSYAAVDPQTKEQGAFEKITADSAGFKDKSYGSRQKIAFDKEGVGGVSILLEVKDVWTEATLEEYVSDDDRLTGAAVAYTDVVNVAPMVDIEPIKYRSSSVYLLTHSEADFEALSALVPQLRAELLAEGVKADVRADRMKVLPSEEWGADASYRVLWEGIFNRGNRDSSVQNFSRLTIEDDYFYTADEDTVYVMRPTYRRSDPNRSYYHYYVEPPLLFSAYSLSDEDNALKWELTVTDEMLHCVFSASDISHRFVLDATDKYLFFRGETETLMINKQKGAVLAKLPTLIGDDVFCVEDNIFYVKSDGVYLTDENLNTVCVYPANIAMKNSFAAGNRGSAKFINRNIYFVQEIDGRPVKTALNADTLRVTTYGFGSDAHGGSSFTVIGWGSDGSLALGSSGGTQAFVDVIDENNEIVKSIGGLPLSYATQCVYKEDGTFDYICSVSNSGSYNSAVRAYGIYDDKTFSWSSYNENAADADASRVMYAVQSGSKFYLVTARWVESSYDGSVSMSSMGYYSYSTLSTFDTETGKVSWLRLVNGGDAMAGAFTGDGLRPNSGFLTDHYIGNATHFRYANTPYETGSNLWARITALPQTLDCLYFKLLNKSVPQEKDERSAVVFYEKDPTETTGMELSGELLAESDAGIFISAAESAEAYTARLRDGIAAAGKSVYEYVGLDDIAGRLAAFFTSDTEEKKAVKIVSGAEENGSGNGAAGGIMKKSYNLEPNKTYYYEVEIEGEDELRDEEGGSKVGAAAWQAVVPVTEREVLTGREYKVSEEYFEDFEDRDTASGLSFDTEKIKGGKYEIVHYVGGGSSYGFSVSGEFSVTVPRGKKAILSFDYEAPKYPYANSRMAYTLTNPEGNTVLWDRGYRPPSEERSGSYTHSRFLSEGTTTVRLVNQTYNMRSSDGTLEIIYTLDNVRVSLIDEASGIAADGYEEGVGSIPVHVNAVDLGEKRMSLQGNFRTLPTVTAYREQASIQLSSDIPEAAELPSLAEFVHDEYDGSSGSSYAYTVEETGIHQISLWGPASDSAGGYVQGYIYLNKGDKIEVFLGAGAEKATGECNGAAGANGSGYNDAAGSSIKELSELPDDKTRLAAVYINEELAMVAGGGGGNGNPNGSSYSASEVGTWVNYNSIPWCSCGWYNAVKMKASGNHYHYYTYVPGNGGSAGVGGNVMITQGSSGVAAGKTLSSSVPSYTYETAVIPHAYYTVTSGTGGKGGSGGASYVNADMPLRQTGWTAGGSRENAKCVISSLPVMTKTSGGQVSRDTNYDIYSYNVPDGFYSAYTRLNGRLNVARQSYSVNVDGTGYSRYPGSAYYNYNTLDDEFTVVSKSVQGARSYSLLNYYGGGSAGDTRQGVFSGLESCLVTEKTTALLEGRFVCDDGDGDGINELLLEDCYTDGRVTFALEFPAGSTAYISDFRLYTYEKGQKVYLEEGGMTAKKLKGWEFSGASGAMAYVAKEAAREELPSLIYQKGEHVDYKVYYSDYEDDPSKSSHWLYAHTPFADGENEAAAIILNEDGEVVSVCGEPVEAGTLTEAEAAAMAAAMSVSMAAEEGSHGENLNADCAEGIAKDWVLNEPIDRFYTDGKYTVYHWQYDDTSRGTADGGYADYDLPSNMASITFYVVGASVSAPWVESIATRPAVPREAEEFSLQIRVDDKEKDVLSLTTEVYRDRKLIYTHRQKNIEAEDGFYPTISTDEILGEGGYYEVVCTVRDETGAGVGYYTFTIVSMGKVTGAVKHTEQWNINRREYNVSLFGKAGDGETSIEEYRKQSAPRMRAENVFWAGERFVLTAEAASNPTKVECSIKGTAYGTVLKSTGRKNAAGEWIYEGELWDKSFMNKWGMKVPEELTFVFTAHYSGGVTKTWQTAVIVDNADAYWKLHRLY